MGTREQGLTFHKMTHQFDYEPIISKMTYPVFPKDTILDLYEQLLTICPEFVASSLGLLGVIGAENADPCASYTPALYRRNAIDLADELDYRDAPRRLREKFLD